MGALCRKDLKGVIPLVVNVPTDDPEVRSGAGNLGILLDLHRWPHFLLIFQRRASEKSQEDRDLSSCGILSGSIYECEGQVKDW